jgi:signal transduction histidine kinase
VKEPSWEKRSTFLLSLLFSFCIIIGGACVVAYNSYTKAIEDVIRSNEERATFLAKLILEHQRATIGVLRSYASRPLLVSSIRGKDFDETVKHLSDLAKNNPEMEWPFIANPDSTIWANFPVDKRSYNKDLSSRDWYKGIKREWKPYISSVFKLIVGENDLAVAVCAPIFDEKGEVVGILSTAQSTAFFRKIIGEVGLNLHAHISLMDQEAHIIYSSRFPYRKEVIVYPSFESIKRATKGEKSYVEIRDPSDGDRIKYVSFAPIEEIGWSIIIEKTKSDVLRSEYSRFVLIAVISFLIFAVATLTLVHLRGRQRKLSELEKLTTELEESTVHIRVTNKALEHEITERKRTEEEIQKLNQDLQERTTELEAFSYSVSHDLRAPLRSIDGFSMALLEDYVDRLDETGKDYFRRIRTATQRMSELIDGLLILSRLTREEIKREAIDLSGITKHLSAGLQDRPPDRPVEFVITEGATAQGDAVMLRVVMENLLGNAWKFTRNHPSARIEFGMMEGNGQEATDKRETIFYVRDDGAGFDMAYSDKLFGLFQRLHSNGDFPGIGIGLTTVRRIIHRHGGRIWAKGEVEKGATFYFTLP